jgi:S-adenosyl-L-methionine hydrolase (adenosine-forming)
MSEPRRTISLLTDFGTRDGFVGVMKGVIAGIAPEANVIDHSHKVPPQDILSASLLLETSYRFFPKGSIHVVVVDPGVGPGRRGLVVESQERFFVGPDNGVLTPVLEKARIHSIENTDFMLPRISMTFHGRDVFAPVAAHLANGRRLEEFGPPVVDPVQICLPQPILSQDGLEGMVQYIDRFGNLITNFDSTIVTSLVAGRMVAVLEDGSEWPFKGTYSDVSPGQPCAVMGGFDRLELSVFLGSAEDRTGAKVGSLVWLHEV